MEGYTLHHVGWFTVQGNVTAGGTLELTTPKTPTGKLWEIQSVSLTDYDNAITAGIFFVRGAGEDMLIDKLANPGAGFPVNYLGQNIHLPEGYQAGVSLTGGTDGDKCALVVHYHENVRSEPTGNIPAEK